MTGPPLSYAAYPAHHVRMDKGAYNMPAEHYPQQPVYGVPNGMMYSHAHLAPGPVSNYNMAPKQHYTLPTQQMYPQVTAPVLPPIRTGEHPALRAPMMNYAEKYQDARHMSQPIQPTHHQEQVKDEQPVGGVSAHLDYKMEEMTDFVAEMAQGMYELYQSKFCLADIDVGRSIQPSSPVSSGFRKFVGGILSSTRLPSSTILLSLYYLSHRMDKMSARGEYKTGTSQIYRLLTIALLLGSKFLDDNTFQNRSWSEVTGLSVQELNKLEAEWLNAIEWRLHRPQDHPEIEAWRGHWEKWLDNLAARSVSALKLSPVDDSFGRNGMAGSSRNVSPIQPGLPSYSNAGTPNVACNELGPSSYQPPLCNYGDWRHGQPENPSPPGIAGPGMAPPTPDYFGVPNAWTSRQPPPPYTARQAIPYASQQPPSYHPTPYVPSHTHRAGGDWGAHGPACGCFYCARPHERYMVPHGFVPQSVAG